MRISEIWSKIESSRNDKLGSGILKMRYNPEGETSLLLGLENSSGSRSGTLQFAHPNSNIDFEIEDLEFITITLKTNQNKYDQITFNLVDRSLAGVFDSLLLDLLDISLNSPIGFELDNIFDRLIKWRDLLQGRSNSIFTLDAQRGLVAELLFFESLLDAGVESGAVLDSWKGPERAHQDFQFSSIAIEVKSTISKKPSSIVITSERELDSIGFDNLFLAFFLLDEKESGSGVKINDLVKRISARLSHNENSKFLSKLVLVGYSEHAQHMKFLTPFQN